MLVQIQPSAPFYVVLWWMKIEAVKRKIWHVYCDYTADGKPFYYGKGDDDRIGNLWDRNDVWGNISNKHGHQRHVIMSTWDEQFAFEVEIEKIAEDKTYIYDEECVLGANLTKGGDGTSGHVHSPETRKLMSEVRKGWTPSEQTREAMRIAHVGKVTPIETREKQSKAKLGKKKSPETCAKMSAYASNRPAEVRKKMGKARRGKKSPQEINDKIRAKLTGRKLSEEHKQNIRLAYANLDPVKKKEKRNKHKRENLSSETLTKMSDASSRPVCKCDADGNVIETYKSVNDAAQNMNVSGSAISHAAHGITKTCKGFRWKMIDKERR